MPHDPKLAMIVMQLPKKTQLSSLEMSWLADLSVPPDSLSLSKAMQITCAHSTAGSQAQPTVRR